MPQHPQYARISLHERRRPFQRATSGVDASASFSRWVGSGGVTFVTSIPLFSASVSRCSLVAVTFVTLLASRLTVAPVASPQCRNDLALLNWLDTAVQRPRGNPHLIVDNINNSQRPTGTSQQQALRKLRKDRPDLHSRVLSGEMSAHAGVDEKTQAHGCPCRVPSAGQVRRSPPARCPNTFDS